MMLSTLLCLKVRDTIHCYGILTGVLIKNVAINVLHLNLVKSATQPCRETPQITMRC